MRLTLSICKEKKKWDDFVETSPQGNIFCTTKLLDVLGGDYELVLIEDNNQLKMGAIILKQNGKPIKAPHPFTMYQGILYSNLLFNQPNHRRAKILMDFTNCLLYKLQEQYSSISFCLHFSVKDIRSFQWFHYHEPERGQFLITLRYTGLLNLATWEDFGQYLLDVRTVRRQEYKKAKYSNLIIESSNDVDILSHLQDKTFARQGIKRKVEEERLLKLITSNALAKKYGKLLVCKNTEGIAISAIVFLYDNRCGYYMFAATDPEYRKTGCGTYLMLESIRQCKEKRLLGVDMVGINSPGRGDFKTSFNAEVVPYFIVHWEKPE